MVCSKCGSENVSIQAITEVKNKKHGFLYWVLIGWWFELIMWFFLTLPWLIIKIFRPKKVKAKTRSIAVCQNCGKRWKV